MWFLYPLVDFTEVALSREGVLSLGGGQADPVPHLCVFSHQAPALLRLFLSLLGWKEHFRQLIVPSSPSRPLASARICVCMKCRCRRFTVLFPWAPRMLTNHRMRFILHLISLSCLSIGLPGGAGGPSAGDVRDLGSIPGSGRSPAGGQGNPLQCSCLENPMDRGAWWATVHGVTKSRA